MPFIPHIHYASPCPDRLYKYCTREVYQKYIRHGCFRVGTHAEYRNAFEEKGAEYGDSYEGNESVLIKGPAAIGDHTIGTEGAMIFDQYASAYVFSMAAAYSADDHDKWFARAGCGYELCVALDGKRFVELLAHRIHRRRQMGPIIAGKPLYQTGLIDLEKVTPKKFDIFLYKNPSLAWENEYRLIYVDQRLGSESRQAIFPESMKLADCIIDVVERKP